MANTVNTSIPMPEAGKYYSQITIGKYKRPKPFESPKFERTFTIVLPLPSEMRDDTTVSYTNQNLETVGDAINGNIGSGMVSGLLRNSGSLTQNIGSAVLGGIASSDFVGTAVANAINPEQVTSAIQQSTGLAPNPNPSVAFQGPILRDYSFSWSFYPKSADESYKIQRMIKILKRSALPRNTVKNSAAILDYPDLVQVNFFPWDADGISDWGWGENSIIKYKKSFMQSVNVNYHPFGTPAFFEGTKLPVSYQINISFRETEYMLSDDWKVSETGYGALGTSNRWDLAELGADLLQNTLLNAIPGVGLSINVLKLLSDGDAI